MLSATKCSLTSHRAFLDNVMHPPSDFNFNEEEYSFGKGYGKVFVSTRSDSIFGVTFFVYAVLAKQEERSAAMLNRFRRIGVNDDVTCLVTHFEKMEMTGREELEVTTQSAD